jgi:hypothetical protein
MRKLIGTIGATLVVGLAAMAASAAPASAACQGPGWHNCEPPKHQGLLPYIEQESVFRLS